jgi:hypothetical protein
VEDVLAAGSFFHYAGGFSKPESFDLTLPETNPVGKLKGTVSLIECCVCVAGRGGGVLCVRGVGVCGSV